LDRKQQIAQAAINQGATLPPTQVNPSFINSILEGISGKQTTAQVASIKNQAVVNAQARKALGLADDVELTPKVLQDYRDVKGQAYEALKSNNAYYTDKKFINDINTKSADLQKLANTTDVSAELNVINGLKQMSFDGVGLVEQMKRLRYDAERNLMSGDPKNSALGKAQKFAANQLEDLAERNLQKFNQPDVMNNFKQARKDIAKSYTIEKSMNLATGDVSGAKLGSRSAAGKIVPSELQALADAAATFPKAFQNPATVGSVPVISPLDLGSAAIASAASGNPLVMGSALTRPAVRTGITSGMYQRNMLPNTKPQTPGLLNRITTDPLLNYGLGQMPEYGTERFLLNR
jgi:ribosomal protein L29